MASSNDMTEEQVKDFIKGIITSNPRVSTIQSIERDFCEFIGTPVPYFKFKYNSVEHFLKNIPDTCVVRGTGAFAEVTLIPSEKSAHINEMVTQQKVNVKGRRKCLAPRRRTMREMEYSMANNRRLPTYNSFSPNTSSSSSYSFGFVNSGSQLKNNNASNTVTEKKYLNIQSCNMAIKNTNCQNPNNQNTSGQNVNTNNTNLVRVIGDLRTENTDMKTNYIKEQDKLEGRKVKERLDNLMKQQVQLGNVTFPTTPLPQIQETLNNSKKINVNDNAPVLDKNALCYLNTSKNNSTADYSKEISEEAYFNKSKEKLNNLLSIKNIDEEEDEDTSNVPRRVQVNLRALISQFNDGIWCNDVPEHYKKLFKKELTYMEYGYTSLIDMCIALKHIFHYVRPERDDFKLYDRSKPLPESVEKLYTMASYDVGEKLKLVPEQALPELEWSDFKGHIPDDIFVYGKEIPREFIPIGTKVENILDVVVVEIYDPSKFWFYLGTSDNNTPLDDLMDSMQTFYNEAENAKEYAIPPGALREGLYCVQVIYGEYHRARIVRVLADCPDHVRVLYIDYGTVCKVPVKGLCFLHSKFATLNVQAIRCRLANIVPKLKGHPWPRSASDRFRELVNRRDTKIKISYIDWNEEYVCVFLADVTDSNNIVYINEVLVKEDHAVWDGETQVIPFVLSNFKCKVKNIHLFPTFFELEYGLVPNSSELYSLQEMLVPLHFCIPHYFDPDEQVLSSDDENDIEEIENSFIETVKNHRKFTAFNKVDVSTVLNPPFIDFDIFGDLKEEMIEFCNSVNLIEVEQVRSEDINSEDNTFCDIEEQTVEMNLEHCETKERKLEDFESVRLIKPDKKASESIIEKLERYSKLGSEYSSSSESIKLLFDESRSFIATCKSEIPDLDFQEELSLEEICEHELSTIFEQSEIELDSSESLSPKNPFFAFGLNNARANSDINIFDNPEEFEGTSDTSQKDENEKPVASESFLRTVELISRKDSEEDNDMLEENNSTAENSSAICPDSENPFIFDIQPDLKEAFKTFLQCQKMSTFNITNGSSCEQSPNVSIQSDIILLEQLEDGTNCEASFLKYNDQNKRLQRVIDNGKERKEDVLRSEERLRGCKSEINLSFRSDLEETQSFVSTLNLNNPFRPYLEATSGKSTDNLSTEDETDTVKITPANSQSTRSATINLLESETKLKDAEAQTTATKILDLVEEDYNIFVPRNDQNHTNKLPVQENLSSWIQSPMTSRGISTPPRLGTPPSVGTPPIIGTPPRLFTPLGFAPVSYPQYPQWSNGAGFPVAQYPPWSNGGNHPGPFQNQPYPYLRENVRPPPGFRYQGPQNFAPNFHTYMGPRMVPTTPIYPPYQGPVYYGPPRQMLPPSLTAENDFYERYNENVLKKLQEGS